MQGVEQKIADLLSAAEPYEHLMDKFMSGSLPTKAFERAYIDTFTDDSTIWPEELYQILNEVFLDVDAYFPDPSFWNDLIIGEDELRRRVARSLEALRSVRLSATR